MAARKKTTHPKTEPTHRRFRRYFTALVPKEWGLSEGQLSALRKALESGANETIQVARLKGHIIAVVDDDEPVTS